MRNALLSCELYLNLYLDFQHVQTSVPGAHFLGRIWKCGKLCQSKGFFYFVSWSFVHLMYLVLHSDDTVNFQVGSLRLLKFIISFNIQCLFLALCTNHCVMISPAISCSRRVIHPLTEIRTIWTSRNCETDALSAACGKFINAFKAVEDNWYSDRLGTTGIECNTHVAK